MLISMTGYGSAQAENECCRVSVEIRCLNSRHLDLVLRLPKNYLDLEDFARSYICQTLRRGRVEVYIQIESRKTEDRAAHIDLQMARYYWKQLHRLHLELPGSDPPRIEHLFLFPGLFAPRDSSNEMENAKPLLSKALADALGQVSRTREAEGKKLSEDLLERVNSLESSLQFLKEQKDKVIESYRDRLQQRLKELLGPLAPISLDNNRLLQELAYFAERSDITEEVVRLESHLGQLRYLILGREPADGRHLDFLTQEVQREVNTIGSKADDLRISQTVIQMKNEISKIREQIQNIE